MIDIHNHILHGLDDGPDILSESLLMARSAVEAGITHIIATPHHKNDLYHNSPIKVLEQTKKLNMMLQELRIDVTIVPGMEIHLNGNILQDMKKDPQELLPLNDGRYVLIELPRNQVPIYTESILFELQLMGYIPILSHVERNSEFRKDPNRLYSFIQRGTLAQVTAGSIVGEMGERNQSAAMKMIHHNLVHFIASDAHDTERRPFKIHEAYKLIKKEFGGQCASYFMTNAEHVLTGQEFKIKEPLQVKKQRKVFRLL